MSSGNDKPEIELPEDDPGEDGLNGIAEEDLAVDQVPEDIFEFTCESREQDEDGLWHYLVLPTEEYRTLDFKGHDVLINGSIRPCKDFYVDEDEGHLVIVSESG